MITEVPELKNISVAENKKEIYNWVAANSHVPFMFLMPLLITKTMANTAGVFARLHEAKRNHKEAMLRNLKFTTVIMPPKK